ncbi:radical SAM family heme chaperone HemW [Shouchella lehensis]|uniref:Heme chaperone HemW n=2 Tax=Shouchella lehensis TaxID=300825 RepID=A0A060M0H6_9BACI|nr:radical SAM family heme chaperone HemW [Shouchella lehensis]AIC94043.1 oxygen-independent coproporphyrinogen-III oxidase [Shouchella lehensis G1]MBG9785677.1 coproporphyrinogen III oxidase [Shouchella lehensis]RQW19962.1 oxygen-independent coproporphyrinogen III oxidase [Bacillus sp. C1-1]TES48139.1 oxygen-independent coproporphyrinogen III oxidase [Shouchella lehensis]
MGDSIYIHIPFCEHICHYCDFNKVFLENQPVDAYVDALIKEVQRSPQAREQRPIRTIYIGGGTPTALTAKQLETLCQALHKELNLSALIEWSVEVNPDSATADRLNVMKRFGVNRLSLGVQTFSQPILTEIGRTHSPEGVHEAIQKARESGFTNLSVDLMLGLPNQSVADFKESLEKALELDVEHISAYMLKVEKQTVFYNRKKKGTLSLPPEEDDVAMYDLLTEMTKAHGLYQYELSNFGKPGYESQHNLVYWNNLSYAGFGAGASGYEGRVRYQNINPIQKYIDAINQNGSAHYRRHDVSTAEYLEEAVFLGLRKRAGIKKADFKERYGFDLDQLFKDEIASGVKKGLLKDGETTLALTEEGLLLANEAFELFVASLDETLYS